MLLMLISARLRELEIDLSSFAPTDRQERERESGTERNGTDERGGGIGGWRGL